MRYAPLFALSLFICANLAQAQRYSYEVLSPVASDNEEAVDMGGSWVLLRDLTSSPPCPVAYHRDSGSTARLCDAGMRDAFAINRKGQVAGYTIVSGAHVAALWSPKKGTETLPFASPSDTLSEALDINDSGLVLGFSGSLASYQCSEDSDYNDTPDVDSEGNPIVTTRKYLAPRAFTWSKAQGSKHVQNLPESLLSVGLSLNSKGDVVVFRQTSSKTPPPISEENPVLCQNYYAAEELIGPFRTCRISRDGKQTCFKRAYYQDSLRCLGNSNELLASCFHNPVIEINRRGETMLGTTLYRGRVASYQGGNEFQGRSDYSSSGALSPSGLIAGYRESAFLENPRERHGIGLTCLAPQNREMKNSSLTTSSLNDSYIFIASFNDKDELLFSADIRGDGRTSQLVLAKPLPRSDWGTHRDFCPYVEASLTTKGVNNIEVNLTASSPLDSYTGVSATIVESDSYYDEDAGIYRSCPERELRKVVLGIDGSAHTSLSYVDRRFDYLVKLHPAFTPSGSSYGAILTNAEESDSQCTTP